MRCASKMRVQPGTVFRKARGRIDVALRKVIGHGSHDIAGPALKPLHRVTVTDLQKPVAGAQLHQADAGHRRIEGEFRALLMLLGREHVARLRRAQQHLSLLNTLQRGVEAWHCVRAVR